MQHREQILALIASADILVDGTNGRLAASLSPEKLLSERFPRLIHARMTPFGDSGPWKDFQAGDLVHLALGGVMMNCGYDPDPTGQYDTPPIAPQSWHAYHIAGDQLAAAIVAALLHQARTGEGQDLCCAVHEAVSKNTEIDVMSWVMRRAPVFRQTARHAVELPSRSPNVSHTKDGRWVMTWGVSARDKAKLVPFLDRWQMAADLEPPADEADFKARTIPGSAGTDEATMYALDVVQRFMRAWRYDTVPWQVAQEAGLLWAPVRKPHENATDPHWQQRATFSEIEHPELGRTLCYPVSKWLSTATAWQICGPAPALGEHQAKLAEWLRAPGVADRDPDPRSSARSSAESPARAAVRPLGEAPAHQAGPQRSAHGLPFALQGVRILDFSWFLASAGGREFWRRWAQRASRWSGRKTPTLGSPPWRRSAAARRASAPPHRLPV